MQYDPLNPSRESSYSSARKIDALQHSTDGTSYLDDKLDELKALETTQEVGAEPEETPVPKRKKRKAVADTADSFNGALVPTQFKLPDDLVQSLKLHAIATGQTMSELVLEALTTQTVISKAWVSTRKSA